MNPQTDLLSIFVSHLRRCFLAWFNNSSLKRQIIFQENLGSKATNNIAFCHSEQYSIEIILPLLILVYSLLNLQNQLEVKKYGLLVMLNQS